MGELLTTSRNCESVDLRLVALSLGFGFRVYSVHSVLP